MCYASIVATRLRISRKLGIDFARWWASVSLDRGHRFRVIVGIPLADAFMCSGVYSFVKSGGFGGFLAHAFSSELEAMSVVNEAIEDCVAESRIAEHDRMPLFWNGSCLTSRSPIRIIFCSGTALRC